MSALVPHLLQFGMLLRCQTELRGSLFDLWQCLGTGFDGTAAPAPKPAFNQRIYAYIDSLPRGEQKKATNALRQYVYGPGNMQPDDALQRYKERRVRDAQAPVGSTDFDDLAASDSDAEESDDDSGLNGGAHDVERQRVADQRAALGLVRRVITRFDDENYSWLDPDLSGPPDSTLNQIYDDQWGLLRNAEQALAGARAEHADRGGENALDGSQLSRILAGAGLTVC